MKNIISVILLSAMVILAASCDRNEQYSDTNVVFLHHSTGSFIWYGKRASVFNRATGLISKDLKKKLRKEGKLPKYFKEYNLSNGTSYHIEEKVFPKREPYGWNNFPYDYYNIWVRNGGDEPYMEEPTLEILTKQYQVIIFKHCFPVSMINADKNLVDINSDFKSISNYKLQYFALRDKLHEFPKSKFILFTGAVHIEANLRRDQAERAREFFDWVKDEWDLPGDNIYLWDLYSLQTEGAYYFKNEYALSDSNSHPNNTFSTYAGKLLFNRIIDVIENNGERTLLTGKKRQ